jgi:hypothetical protein
MKNWQRASEIIAPGDKRWDINYVKETTLAIQSGFPISAKRKPTLSDAFCAINIICKFNQRAERERERTFLQTFCNLPGLVN